MITLVTVYATSPLLKDVQSLWGKNRSFLGLYPKGAFEDRAAAGHIIGAVIDEKLAGYLLYFTNRTKRRAQITHLCVTDSCRSKGVARSLVNELVERTKHLNGIALHCCRDFPAHEMWPKLGFTAHSTKPGRTGQSELTRFSLQHSHPGLFDADDDDDERVVVVMDANVFYDLDTPGEPSGDESRGLEADWLIPLIRLCYTDELRNDINRCTDPSKRERSMRRCSRYHRLESPGNQHSQIESEIHVLLGAAKSGQDQADRRHLARAIFAGGTVFVTRDEGLLSVGDKIYQHYGLEVLRPAKLISRFGEVQNSQAFQRDPLRGTTITTQRVGAKVDGILDHFHDSQFGKKSVLEQLVRTALADPINMEIHVVKQRGEPLALYIVDRRSAPVLSVPVFRLAKSIRSQKFRNSLARTLITEITTRSPPKAAITFTDPASGQALDSINDLGFLTDASRKSKVKIAGVLRPPEVAAELRALAGCDTSLGSLGKLAIAVEQPKFLTDSVSVFNVEHALWPMKILGSGLPCFIVPIRPDWALHLFDSKLASNTLEGADTRLAFNAEFVHYRSVVGAKGLEVPARILWYVSGERVVGGKHVRAASRMTEVIRGPKQEVFKANRNLGVYEWRDVLNASKRADVMALRCSDTERFQRPVAWKTIQPVLAAEGIKNNLVAPGRISEEGFFQIYRMAFPEQ